jgi:hypothetical protein
MILSFNLAFNNYNTPFYYKRMTIYKTLTGTSVKLEEFCAKYGIFSSPRYDTSNEYHNIYSSFKTVFYICNSNKANNRIALIYSHYHRLSQTLKFSLFINQIIHLNITLIFISISFIKFC